MATRTAKKVNYTQFIEEVANSLGAMSAIDIEESGVLRDLTDRKFGRIFTPEIEKAYKEICKTLGGEYKGLSFDYWKQGASFTFVGPKIYSDSVSAICKWGNNSWKLEGEIVGKVFGDFLIVPTKNKKGFFKVRILTQHDGTDKDMSRVKEELGAADTWEETVDCLKVKLENLDRDVLFSLPLELKVTSKDLREKDTRHFWAVAVNCSETGPGMIYLPEAAKFKVGDVIKTLPDKNAYLVNGQEHLSNRYVKLSSLKKGEVVRVFNVEPASGQYGGYVMHSDKGFVNSNTQFNKWYEALNPEVTPNNAVLVTILDIQTRKNGNHIVQLGINPENKASGFGLDALLGDFGSGSDASHTQNSSNSEESEKKPEAEDDGYPSLDEIEKESTHTASLQELTGAASSTTVDEQDSPQDFYSANELDEPKSAVAATAANNAFLNDEDGDNDEDDWEDPAADDDWV